MCLEASLHVHLEVGLVCIYESYAVQLERYGFVADLSYMCLKILSLFAWILRKKSQQMMRSTELKAVDFGVQGFGWDLGLWLYRVA